ncbi:DUF2064 domain-containing protein [Marinobacterium aestuariivivens]|uniref:DUF2064 domain-containing protein n=1 Tax=Marinobacterium aestuariivivens TaxID=1698799 RepID=A0ABW2A7F5_9GAMM
MPEQTPEMLLEAAALLRRQDVVLSPAEDGGVTLMASRCPWPDLADLPWSTPELGRALAERCTGAGLEVGTMTPCADVDEWADLERLRTTLATDLREPQQALHKLIRELLR